MTSNSFRLHVLERVLLITLLTALLLFAVFQKHWIATSIVLFLLTCLSVASLCRYVERSSLEFADFLQSIRSGDFTRHDVSDKRGKSFSALKHAFNAIVDEFQTARIDKEAHYIFLQTVVSNINTGIISFDSAGNIRIFNDYARTLLNLPFLDNVHQLSSMNPGLYNILTAGTNEVAEVDVLSKRLKLLIRSASFRLQEGEHRLVLLTNVKTELDRTEVEAWEQLLHVLTHEIMNSITPISSLSGTMRNHLNGIISSKQPDGEMLNDMAEGMRVIESRSAGLIDFVNNYKSLITLPKPVLKTVNIEKLLDRMRVLTGTQLAQAGITLRIHTGSGLLFVIADEALVEQVLLNLIYNAVDALAGVPQPVIELSAVLLDEKTLIRISDNGKGIDADILGRIFIPFFTTKNTGTGIGLSLSRQIMRMHNGGIDVYSQPGKGAVFTLSFP